MAANNLRIIYNNLVDSATTSITASSTASSATPATNLAKDGKTSVWRSVANASSTSVKVVLIVNLGSSQIVGGVALPFCNLTSVAQIRVRGYTGTAPTINNTAPEVPTVTATGTQVFDTGYVNACPYQPLGQWAWGTLPLGVNAYSYGGGTYGRIWFNQLSCTSLAIEITDTNSSKYIEAARLVIGAYWSPKFNTSYGLSTTQKDMSEHTRTESGDLVTNRGIRYNTMTFDLNWLTASDRVSFNQIVKGNGMPRPLFISLFPDNSTDYEKEQAHQIYGKLSQLGAVSHPIYEMYSTQVDIEEI